MYPKDTPSDIPFGYCHCGCGQKTNLYTTTNRREGRIKGEPARFVFAHHNRLQVVTPNKYRELDDGSFVLELTRGFETIIDAQDFPLVHPIRWYAHSTTRQTYAASRPTGGTTEFIHRLVMEAPDGAMVDHINGDGLDNRRANLRICSNQENQRNRKIATDNSSGFKGVSWHLKYSKWFANIRAEGRQVFLGSYDSIEDAAHAYDNAARKYFGEFAALNFPKEGERAA